MTTAEKIQELKDRAKATTAAHGSTRGAVEFKKSLTDQDIKALLTITPETDWLRFYAANNK